MASPDCPDFFTRKAASLPEWTLDKKKADSGHSGHVRLAVGLEVGLPDPELAVGLRRWLSEQ